MLLHMARRFLHVFLAVWLVTLPFTTFRWFHTLFNEGKFADAASFALVTGSVGAYLLAGQVRAGVPFLSALAAAPAAISLYVALSFSLAWAYLSGLFQRGGEFTRTPKTGRDPIESGPRYRSPFDRACLVETAAGLLYARFAMLAFHRHLRLHGTFFAWIALALLYVGLGTLLERRSA
jgi:hypothetical protein